MYTFKVEDIDKLDKFDLNSFDNKPPFTTIEWINFLVRLKKIKPVIISIYEKEEKIGYFTGGICRFFGIKVLGSPFWGWMGQHMGFDLHKNVDKATLVDDLIDFAVKKLRAQYIQITDYKIDFEDIEHCRHKLIPGERYKTCYIDLTLPTETLFKNLKSGYRTCVRKFEKEGGIIVEDYSAEFIEKHHDQLAEVFLRQERKVPDYKKKMSLIFNNDDFKRGEPGVGVYSIKAMVPMGDENAKEMTTIATSYYIYNEYMAMFTSNASYTQYLKLCPNQALTWHAMMKFKEMGIKVLDMGGSGDYKLNFSGGDWEPKPVIIYSKGRWAQFVVIGAKRTYSKLIAWIGKCKNRIFTWKKERVKNKEKSNKDE